MLVNIFFIHGPSTVRFLGTFELGAALANIQLMRDLGVTSVWGEDHGDME